MSKCPPELYCHLGVFLFHRVPKVPGFDSLAGASSCPSKWSERANLAQQRKKNVLIQEEHLARSPVQLQVAKGKN